MDKDLQVKRETYRKDLSTALERIVRQLSSRRDVQKVILFGSFSCGKRDLFTDLDLLVVLESKLDFVSRTAELYRSLNAGVDLDLLVYTPEEYKRMSESGFLKHVMNRGEILYEK